MKAKTLQFNFESFNPDCMTQEDLWAWAEFVGNGRRPQVAKQWFPGMKGQFRYARYVRHYCVNKAVAMDLRVKGNIQEAMKYEAICDRIYAEDLPQAAKWQRVIPPKSPTTSPNKGTMKAKRQTELHKCDICGKTAILESGKRHWCDCNQHTPFYMHSVKAREMIDHLIGAMLNGIKRNH